MFDLVILPIFIFLSRICDVSLGTIRIISVSRGRKLLAAVLGFFEVLIWVIVISRLIQHLDNILYYVSYAGGFAAGNYVGMWIEEKLAVGTLIVRIVTAAPADKLIAMLKDAGFGVTNIPAQGALGKVNLIFTIINRRDLPDVISYIKQCNPNAFYSIEDVRFVSHGTFPHHPHTIRTDKRKLILPRLFPKRKGK